MIRRNRRGLPSLSKRILQEKLIGGTAPHGAVCFGYEQNADGLSVCPAPSEQSVITVTTFNLHEAKWHPSFGFELLMYTNGISVVWNREKGNCYNFCRQSPGEPFSAEARNGQGDPLLIVVCGNQMCVCNGTTDEKVMQTLPAEVYGGVVHCGRLFAVDCANGYKVVWSGLRVTDWQEGIQGSGYVLLDGDAGKILKLENFGDDLLCVRERGFTVLHAMADSRNFRIAPSQCAVCTGGKINVGGMVGNKYYFTADGGLYFYDGNEITLAYAVNNVFTSCSKAYAYGDGYVYADCVYNGINCIMRFNVRSGEAVFFGRDCSSPFVSDGKLYCAKDFEFHQLSVFNEEERLWRSEPLEICGKRVLKNVWVTGSGDVKVTVHGGGERRTFNGLGKLVVNVAGEDTVIEISGHCNVTRALAESEVRK